MLSPSNVLELLFMLICFSTFNVALTKYAVETLHPWMIHLLVLGLLHPQALFFNKIQEIFSFQKHNVRRDLSVSGTCFVMQRAPWSSLGWNWLKRRGKLTVSKAFFQLFTLLYLIFSHAWTRTPSSLMFAVGNLGVCQLLRIMKLTHFKDKSWR